MAKNETKKGNRNRFPYKKLAATYFSTNKCSIIGDVRLNFTLSAEPTPSARNAEEVNTHSIATKNKKRRP